MSRPDPTLPRAVTVPLIAASAMIVCFLTAAVFWSVYAPLATTLHVSGMIVSSQPTLDLQHPYGGEIADVYVQKHAHVEKGDALLRLDDRLDRASLAALRENRARILAENQAIEDLFHDADQFAAAPQSGPAAALQLKHHTTVLQQQTKSRSALSLREQAQALDAKIDVATAQLGLMQTRSDRQADLVGQGLVPRVDFESEQERLFIVQGEIQSDKAQLYALRDQARQTQEQGDLAAVALRAELAAKREANLRAIEEMDPKIAELEDRIAKALVRAPAVGTVTDLQYVTKDMFVPRGASLVTLAKPLEQPHISFSIPTSQIDQLSLGMTGNLIIPSLPQRSMPKVTVTVTAISPRAKLDEAGQPTAYEGRAEIQDGSMEIIRAALGDISLSEDMPVNLTLEARETTLADYLITPFLASFRNALQD